MSVQISNFESSVSRHMERFNIDSRITAAYSLQYFVALTCLLDNDDDNVLQDNCTLADEIEHHLTPKQIFIGQEAAFEVLNKYSDNRIN